MKSEILLLLIFMMVVIPITHSQSPPFYAIPNIQSVNGFFYSNVTHDTYVVGSYEGQIYVWMNYTPIPIAQGFVNTSSLQGDYVVIEGYVVINSSQYPRIWIFNTLNEKINTINTNIAYNIVGSLDNVLILTYNQDKYLYLTGLNLATGKFVTNSFPLNPDFNAGVLLVNTTGNIANLLIWFSNDGALQVNSLQIQSLGSSILQGATQLIVQVNNGLVINVTSNQGEIALTISGSPSYLVMIGKSTIIKEIPNLNNYIGTWILGDTAYLLNGNSLITVSSNVNQVSLPGQANLVVPGPFNLSYVWIGNEIVVSTGTSISSINSSVGFNAQKLLYEDGGTGYITYPGGIAEINLYTGQLQTFPLQGTFRGYAVGPGTIFVLTMSSNQANVFTITLVPSFTAEIFVNYNGEWTLLLGNVDVNLSGSLTLTLPSQEYHFVIEIGQGYEPIHGIVSPSNSTFNATPTKSLYTIVVVETGIEQPWTLVINGTPYNVSGTPFSVMKPVGTYLIRIMAPQYYTFILKSLLGQDISYNQGSPVIQVSPSQSSYSLSGKTFHNVSLVLLVNFSEEKFPLIVRTQGINYSWVLDLNGTLFNITGNKTLDLYPGVYYVKVLNPNGLNFSAPLIVKVPTNTSLTVTFLETKSIGNSTISISNTTGIETPPNTTQPISTPPTTSNSLNFVGTFYFKAISLVVLLVVAIAIGYKIK
ncbi:hypothetical protein [Metallosphaera hakonensis]|uniref:hypothetical protein n=1 Tax=Metallosphaera hakonensis TaxID=79601 RepID=UPI0011B1FA11|nr:hypothetical protein [Metallosphaera hakonensis]AWR99116.2 hypothetical protein DFR87_04730 [Metallosphaera hakonensis JCM 8857 = DSM 7519]